MGRKNSDAFEPDAEIQYKEAIEFYSLLDRDIAARFRSYVAMDGLRENIGFETFDELADFFEDENATFFPPCPNNQGHKVIAYGKDRHGVQRYQCTECKKTFTRISNTLISHTKKPIEAWFTMIDSLYNMRSVEETAELCGMSATAVMAWRQKIFYVLAEKQKSIRLSNVIISDETFFPTNYKGKVDTVSIAKRTPRRRGSQNTRKNYHKNQACVVCALDNSGRSFSRFAGFGTPTKTRILRAFEEKIDTSADGKNILVTDGSKAYSALVDYYRMEWQRKPSKKIGKGKYVPDTSGEYNIQSINAYHKRLKAFLRKCQGVATRYLQGYLQVFDWRENNKKRDKKEIYLELLHMLSTMKSSLTNKEISQQFVPFLYEDQIRENWKSSIPVWQRKLFIDTCGLSRTYTSKELLEKYPQVKNARQIKRIAAQIHYLRLANEILDWGEELKYTQKQEKNYRIAPTEYKKAPSITREEREAWRYKIYKDVRSGKLYKVASAEYSISTTAICNLAKHFDNSPLKIAKKKAFHPDKGKIQAEKRYQRRQEIVRTYSFFKASYPELSQQEVYGMAAQELSCSATRVRNVVCEERLLKEEQEDSLPRVKDRRKRERMRYMKRINDLPEHGENVAFVKITERNSTVMADYLSRYDKGKKNFTQIEIMRDLADKYNLSVNTIRAILYTYRNAGFDTLESLNSVQNEPQQNNTRLFDDLFKFKAAIQPFLDRSETKTQCINRLQISRWAFNKYYKQLKLLLYEQDTIF